MSCVVKNIFGFRKLLADCPSHQRHFLLRTATPQQMHAMVQVLLNVLNKYIPIPEENRRKLLQHEETLSFLASPVVPYKTKKHILVQDVGGFVQDLLVPVITTLGLMML